MFHIAAIEGINFSGKTTLITDLVKDCDKYTRLYELSDKYKDGMEFPKFSIDYNTVLKQDTWFFKEEEIRNADAMTLAKQKSILADRWVTSLFAYAYARRKIYHINDTTHLSQLCRSTQIITPWLIYLTPENDFMGQILSRTNNISQKNRRCIEIPYTKEFYEAQLEYYEKLLQKLGSGAFRLPLRFNQENNMHKIIEWIEKKDKPYNIMKIGDMVL